MHYKTYWAAFCAAVLVVACADEGLVGDTVGGQIEIGVAALTLEGVSNANYTITVTNAADDTVWSQTIDSNTYGDGAGDVTFVGPCDAQSNPNTVSLVLEDLFVSGVALNPVTEYFNPAPSTDPLEQNVTCTANEDASVVYNLAIVRAADQGFFDIVVQFDNIFCSAKLDCAADGGGDLDFLFNPHTGERDLTAVAGFACTAGATANTTLSLDTFRVDCDNGGPFIVDVSAAQGNQDPTFTGPPNTTDLFFQTAIYRDVEDLPNVSKAFWNVAMGLNADAFTTLGACNLTGAGTVTDGPLDDGVTPPQWPYVQWNVPLTNSAGDFVCGANELGNGTAVLPVKTGLEGRPFYASFNRGTEAVSTFPTLFIERGFSGSIHWGCATDVGTPGTTDQDCLPTSPSNYAFEFEYRVPKHALAGTIPLYLCERPGNHFLTSDPGCNGATGVTATTVVAHIFENEIPGVTMDFPLEVCRFAGFEDYWFGDCTTEGQTFVDTIGFALLSE